MFLRAICAYTTRASAIFVLYSSALAQTPVAAPSLQTWGQGDSSTAPAPWRVVGLPPGKAPLSTLEVVRLDGERVLRLRTQASYSTLHHALPPGTRVQPGQRLQWQWRLEEPLAQADLRQKQGDDAALKVCALYDLPLEALSFSERTLMRLARSTRGEHLPAATVCYVWDTRLPSGTVLPNAYSRRVRWMVVDGAEVGLGQWRSHQRDLHADFLRSFGDDSATVPPLLAIVVGADADNTGGQSLGYLRAPVLTAP